MIRSKNIASNDSNCTTLVKRKIDEYAKTHSRKTTHEVLLKIKTALRDAYTSGYPVSDFASLVKTRGEQLPKRNKVLSITDFRTLRRYILENTDDEFNVLVLLALETGMRRSEILGIRAEDVYEYGIKVRRSINQLSWLNYSKS